MKLRDRFRRWWQPGEYDDERRGISDGAGFALPREESGDAVRYTPEIVHPRNRGPVDPPQRLRD